MGVEWGTSMDTIIKHIQKRCQINFKDSELLLTAFRHTSYVNEHTYLNIEHNERLEFLGDAVLELISSNYLYHEYPDQPEGYLTRLRAQLVQEKSLALVARQYAFNDIIMLGKGEQANGGAERDSILSDCFEAFLGAVYLDQGLETVTAFLTHSLLGPHQEIIKQVTLDYKTLLQEKLQAKGQVQISYQLLTQEGPAHQATFFMGLYVNDQLISQGQGRSKKIAEMNAAKAALAQLDQKGKFIHVSK